MEDPADQLIRRALARRPPPTPGPTFVEDVLRSVAMPEHLPVARAQTWARRRLAAGVWLLAAAASVAVLANMEWPAAWRSIAWGLALAVVPLAYSAALWPGRWASLLALCSGSSPAPLKPRVAGSLTVRERG